MTFISNLSPWPPLLPAPPYPVGWGLVCVTPAVVEPLTVTEVKNHARIEVPDDDWSLIPRYIRAARHQFERDTNRFLITQTWDLFLDALPARSIPLTVPRPPLQSIVSVTTRDPSNVSSVRDATTDYVDTASEPGRVGLVDTAIWPQNLRSFQPITVRFVAGYTGYSRGGGIVTATWAANVATITTASTHGFATGEQVVIAGVTAAGYNGTFEATVLNATQFTYALTNNPGASGSGTASDLGVPSDDREAILMLVGHYYENREASIVTDRRITVEQMPIGYDDIVQSRRIHGFA
jgi:uncharacterized phiE125 gp8 family phage protein